MSKNFETFENQSKRFFDNNLMYIVYQTEDLCVCNLANQCYVVFDYNEIKGQHYGYMGGVQMAKMVIDSPTKLYEYIMTIGEKNISTYLFHFSDRSFELISTIKQKNDINGPSKSIDFAFEEEIMRNSNNRGR